MTETGETGALFTRPMYLDALHAAGCVGEESGWQPCPELGPLAWLKSHSWGEFVFDFEIAGLYQRCGLSYYPKLIFAVPYTPVPGPRIAGLKGAQIRRQRDACGASSAHVLFACGEERDRLLADGWLRRRDLRFVWRNRGYADFADFLAALSSKKRKNIRAERRAVAQLGLRIEWCHAAELAPQHWPRVYQLYARTYALRGQAPYLNQACLQVWAESLGQAMQLCLAWQNDQIVAMAFFFAEEGRLYGRHWGSLIDGEKLHFELCYYQGIERAIALGVTVFDAGVQGSHRLLRGFEPELTDSLHHFAEPRLQALLQPALARECEHVEAVFAEARTRIAYRRSDDGRSACPE